jgi:hypothetical protein
VFTGLGLFCRRTIAAFCFASMARCSMPLHGAVRVLRPSNLRKIGVRKRADERLASIAADEGRHSAHGWQVTMRCVREADPNEIHDSEIRAAPHSFTVDAW